MPGATTAPAPAAPDPLKHRPRTARAPPAHSTHRPRTARAGAARARSPRPRRPGLPDPPPPSATIGSVIPNPVTAQDEVVDICRDLIRMDTSNPGDHSGPGERQAAEYVAARLAEAGLEPTVLESHPKRTSVVARIEGRESQRPAL